MALTFQCSVMMVFNLKGDRNHGSSMSLAQHIRHQIEDSLDRGCQRLGKQGARGARGTLFKLTPDSHGYTFVAKGTVEAFIHSKAKACGASLPASGSRPGELILVYLGNISLMNPYFLGFGVRIMHMLLISWAGEQAQQNLMSRMSLDIEVETNQVLTKLRAT